MLYLIIALLIFIVLTSLYYNVDESQQTSKGKGRGQGVSGLGLIITVIGSNYFSGVDFFSWPSEYLFLIFFFIFMSLLMNAAQKV